MKKLNNVLINKKKVKKQLINESGIQQFSKESYFQ